tara:strand:+ start:219 stop:2432 length:2214 start_codon:yes stop_codon:yes gene_type:complete
MSNGNNNNNNNNTDQQLIAVLQEIRQSLARATPTAEGPGAPRLTREEQRAQINFLMEEQENLTTIVKSYEEIGKRASLDLDYLGHKQKLNENHARMKREEIKSKLEAGELDAAAYKILEKEVYKYEKKVEVVKALYKHAKTFEATIEEAAAASDEMGKSLGSAFQVFAGNKASGAIVGVTKALQGGHASAIAFGASLGMALGMAMIDNIVNLVVEIYNTERAFRKATGGSQEFANSMTATYTETRRYGVSLEEASKAHQDLFTTFTDFTMISEKNREDLGKTAAILSKLGVSTQDFAKGTQMATKALGVGVGDVDETMLDLQAHALDLGIAPQKLMADFAGAGASLAKFGADGVQAFRDLALASKITGIEISRILAIAAKFDTFEGAAEQAGKLNAALGGNFVNAMDLMMTTDPVERFNMIRDSILSTGLTFDTMSHYQRIFFAESAGLNDVGELALMLSGNFDSLDDSIGKNSKSYEEAAARAASFQSIQEQLKAIMADMIPVIEPLINMLANMAKWLQENKEFTANLGQAMLWLAITLGAVAVVTLLLQAPVTAIVAGFAAAYLWVSKLKDKLMVERSSPTFVNMLADMGVTMHGLGDATTRWGSSLSGVISRSGKLKDKLFGGPGLNLGEGVGALGPDLEAATKGATDLRKAITTIPQETALMFSANEMGAGATGARAAPTAAAARLTEITNNNFANAQTAQAPAQTFMSPPVELHLDGAKVAEAVAEVMYKIA